MIFSPNPRVKVQKKPRL